MLCRSFSGNELRVRHFRPPKFQGCRAQPLHIARATKYECADTWHGGGQAAETSEGQEESRQSERPSAQCAPPQKKKHPRRVAGPSETKCAHFCSPLVKATVAIRQIGALPSQLQHSARSNYVRSIATVRVSKPRGAHHTAENTRKRNENTRPP